MILKGKVSSVMFRIGVRDAGDASHAAKIVIIALSSMLVTTLIVNIWCWWIVMTVLLIILGL